MGEILMWHRHAQSLRYRERSERLPSPHSWYPGLLFASASFSFVIRPTWTPEPILHSWQLRCLPSSVSVARSLWCFKLPVSLIRIMTCAGAYLCAWLQRCKHLHKDDPPIHRLLNTWPGTCSVVFLDNLTVALFVCC